MFPFILKDRFSADGKNDLEFVADLDSALHHSLDARHCRPSSKASTLPGQTASSTCAMTPMPIRTPYQRCDGSRCLRRKPSR